MKSAPGVICEIRQSVKCEE